MIESASRERIESKGVHSDLNSTRRKWGDFTGKGVVKIHVKADDLQDPTRKIK